jgi:hypothetical protein
MTPLPQAIAQALAPFAPPQSEVRRQAEDAARIRSDLALVRLQHTGAIWRMEADRTHLEELKWGDHE